VAVGGLKVEDGDLNIGVGLLEDLEELALGVGLHVEGADARRAGAAGREGRSATFRRADAGELDVEEVRVHRGEDTNRAQGVRWRSR
jgi:hypothetical protein